MILDGHPDTPDALGLPHSGAAAIWHAGCYTAISPGARCRARCGGDAGLSAIAIGRSATWSG